MNENVNVLSGQSIMWDDDVTVRTSQMSQDADATVRTSQMSQDADATVRTSQMSQDADATVRTSQMLQDADATVRTSQMSQDADATVRTSQTSQSASNWDPELRLGFGEQIENYVITGYLRISGEAELYTAQKDGKDYAFKLYKSKGAIKKEVADKLVGKQFKHLAYMVEWGETEIANRRDVKMRMSYEVLPLYKKVDVPLPYEKLKQVIAHAAEGLNELHKMGIYHKDIKPANIMMDEDNNYRIIDFGVSTIGEEGQTHKNDTEGMTFNYASPDVRMSRKAGPAEDFYSLGISIYEFFTGKLPYEELGNHNNRYTELATVGIKVRESQNIPTELVKLLHGLTFYSNNNDLNKKRWGYEEVMQWLQNPDEMEDLDMEVLGGTNRSEAYFFDTGKEELKLYDNYSLADALGSYWRRGIKDVGRGYITDHFKKIGGESIRFARLCDDVADIIEQSTDEWKINEAYWKLLYAIEPNLKKFYWPVEKENEMNDYTCEEAGVYFFLAPLRNNQRELLATTKKLVEKGILDTYLKNLWCDTNSKYQLAKRLMTTDWTNNSEKASWKLGYLLSGKALFQYNGEYFENKKDLFEYIVNWTNGLSRTATLAVAGKFERTTEFCAWEEWEAEKR